MAAGKVARDAQSAMAAPDRMRALASILVDAGCFRTMSLDSRRDRAAWNSRLNSKASVELRDIPCSMSALGFVKCAFRKHARCVHHGRDRTAFYVEARRPKTASPRLLVEFPVRFVTCEVSAVRVPGDQNARSARNGGDLVAVEFPNMLGEAMTEDSLHGILLKRRIKRNLQPLHPAYSD